jgi:hypothetical protein
MQGMHEIKRPGSPDLLTFRKTVNRCECRFESCATAVEAVERATPAFMKFWEKIGVVELWRVSESSPSLVRAEALIVQVVDT